MTNQTTRLLRILALATLTGATLLSGCSVMRGQETAGAYVDDAAITTAIKAKFVEDKIVSAGSISVETLNGTVQLSGFANSAEEKSKAEKLYFRQCTTSLDTPEKQQ